MTKIHVLADEKLGGIMREYVEVDRKAEVGEKIVIVDKNDPDDVYENGDILTVDREFNTVCDHVESGEARSVDNIHGVLLREEYHVLEPTDVVHIDGGRFEMVDCKAGMGEKVMCLDDTGGDLTIGGIYTIDEIIEEEDGTGYGFIDNAGEGRAFWDEAKYRVLVPAAADEPQPADPIFAIGNVAQEVAKLKRTVDRITDDLGWNEMGPGRIPNLRNDVSDIKRDIASIEEKVDHNCEEIEETDDYVYVELKRTIERLENEIDTLHKDNRTLGEELARLKEPAKSDDILDAPFVLALHEGRGKFDVYRRGRKLEEIAEIEVEVQADVNTKVRIGHFPGDWLV